MLFLTNFYWSVQQAIIYYEHFHRSPSTWPLICPVTRPSKQVPEGLHWHPKGKQLFMDSGKGAWKLLLFEHLSHECNRKDQYCCRWICTRNKCCCPVEQFWWRFQLSVCTWQVFRLPLCAIRCIWLKKKKFLVCYMPCYPTKDLYILITSACVENESWLTSFWVGNESWLMSTWTEHCSLLICLFILCFGKLWNLHLCCLFLCACAKGFIKKK